MSTFADLIEFVNRATKSRKYPENTSQGLRAALKLFEVELNDEERKSLDEFDKNLEQIYRTVSSKNGLKYTAASLAVYKSRIKKVISDFKAYGLDPSKMANWSPKIVVRSKRGSGNDTKMLKGAETPEVLGAGNIDGMHRIELSLRPNTKFTVIVPMDITSGETAAIKAVLDSLVKK
jgi:site-specific recombinase XerD